MLFYNSFGNTLHYIYHKLTTSAISFPALFLTLISTTLGLFVFRK